MFTLILWRFVPDLDFMLCECPGKLRWTIRKHEVKWIHGVFLQNIEFGCFLFSFFFFPPWETIQHTRVYLWLKRKWTWSKTYLCGFLVFAFFLVYVTECIFVSFKLDISSWLNSVRICWFRVFQMGLYSYNFRLFQTISILNRNSIIIFIKIFLSIFMLVIKEWRCTYLFLN